MDRSSVILGQFGKGELAWELALESRGAPGPLQPSEPAALPPPWVLHGAVEAVVCACMLIHFVNGSMKYDL